MTGVDGFQLAIDEIDTEVIALAELEAQLDDAVLKLDVVEDRDAVIGFGVLRDVHHAVFEIDLLVAFGPPAAVAGPAVADVLLAGRGFIAGEVIGEEQRGLGGHEENHRGHRGAQREAVSWFEVVEVDVVELERFDVEVKPSGFASVDHLLLIMVESFDFEVAVRHAGSVSAAWYSRTVLR
jgi:hypothetical protein